MHTIIFILSIVFLIAGALLLAIAINRNTETKQMSLRQEELSVSLAKREAACREAMRKNGQASLELTKKEMDFDLHHEEIYVHYADTAEDMEKYPSEAKRLAVAKSRLAHNLGYKILSIFPNPAISDTAPVSDGNVGKLYEYMFLVSKCDPKDGQKRVYVKGRDLVREEK